MVVQQSLLIGINARLGIRRERRPDEGKACMRIPKSIVLVVVAALAGATLATGGVAGAKGTRLKKPGAPTSLVVTPLDAAITASWSAPASDGGSAVIGYRVAATPGSATCITAATTCTVTGLTNGKKYTVKVSAVNGVGQGKAVKQTKVVPVPRNTYCGTKHGAPTTSKLMVIYEENTDATSIYGSRLAPNINRYAAECGSAQNYQTLTHPSLPNYLASTSGLPYAASPWTSDCDPGGTCLTGNDNIFHQVGASGWKAFAESMSGDCSTSGTAYASKHNPAEYYTDVSPQCPVNDVPMGTTASGALHDDVVRGALPTFATVTPNLGNDMHDGTRRHAVRQGDTWLAGWMDQIVAGPDYQSGRLTVLIVWDEGGGGSAPNTVAMIAISPYVVPGTTSSTYLTHYSVLKAAEDVAHVPELGGAATADSLRAAFGF